MASAEDLAGPALLTGHRRGERGWRAQGEALLLEDDLLDSSGSERCRTRSMLR